MMNILTKFPECLYEMRNFPDIYFFNYRKEFGVSQIIALSLWRILKMGKLQIDLSSGLNKFYLLYLPTSYFRGSNNRVNGKGRARTNGNRYVFNFYVQVWNEGRRILKTSHSQCCQPHTLSMHSKLVLFHSQRLSKSLVRSCAVLCRNSKFDENDS